MKNRLKYGLNSLIVTAAVIAGILIVNAIVSVIGSKAELKLDLTQDKIYEFSDWTKEAVKAVEKEAVIYALYPNSAEGDNVYAVREHLEKYAKLNKKISVEYIDPYTNPAFTQRYTAMGEEVSEGTIVVECSDKYRIVPFQNQFRRGVINDEERNTLYLDMEKSVTNAILYVTSDSKGKTIYFTQGHSETSIVFPEILRQDGRSVDTFDLIDGVPEDAAMVVVSAPMRDMTQEEISLLDDYLKDGGKLMYMTASGAAASTLLNTYISEWGIDVNDDFVVEEDSDYQLSIHNDKAEISDMQSHEITDNIIAQKLKLLSPVANSLTAKDANTHNAVTTVLLKSSDKSWSAKTQDGEIMKDTAVNGPCSIAVMSESMDDNGGKVFVMSSVLVAEMSVSGQPVMLQSSYANRDFVFNTISYMCEEKGGNQTRIKDLSTNLLSLTESQMNMWRIILMYLLPVGIIALGVIVYRKRRFR